MVGPRKFQCGSSCGTKPPREKQKEKQPFSKKKRKKKIMVRKGWKGIRPLTEKERWIIGRSFVLCHTGHSNQTRRTQIKVQGRKGSLIILWNLQLRTSFQLLNYYFFTLLQLPTKSRVSIAMGHMKNNYTYILFGSCY